MASDAYGQIIFTGFLPEYEVPVYFSAADLVVLPYNTPELFTSGPLMLAIGYEKPIAVSNIPSFKDLIQMEEALFERASPESLAKKLELMLTDNGLRYKVLAHIRNIKMLNSWENIGLKTCMIYREICEGENEKHA
jgi:glycosyltransferase involved in cell wall biosynthesis